MRRKVYADDYKRKYDQRIGAVAFIVVNVIVYLLYRWLNSSTPGGSVDALSFLRFRSAVEFLPWVVNGAILVWAFIFRPQLALGYIACFGTILAICAGLFAIFVASCVVIIPLAIILPQAVGSDSGATLASIIWIGLLLIGSIWFLVFGFKIVAKWWRGD